MRSTTLRSFVVGVLALALAACTGGTADREPPATPTATAAPAAELTPHDVVATARIHSGWSAMVDVQVYPLVRVGEHVVLTVDLTAADPAVLDERSVLLHGFGGAANTVEILYPPVGLRLLDLERDVVHHVARGSDGRPVVGTRDWESIRTADGTRLQAAYAAPPDDVTSLSLFMPGAPLFADVPVIEGEPPSPVRPEVAARSTATPDEPPVLDLSAVAAAPTYPLESASTELAGAVRTIESVEKVEVNLGSDVLFEFDQDTLTPGAAEVLDLVAQRLTEREPGTVTVVGHTDDQGDEAYNLDLSRRRAQTVADALAAAVDAARYPMQVEGRGEAEPFVDNTSDENRARNRRVTVTLESTVVTRTDVTTAAELPPFGDEGAVGAAGQWLRVPGAGDDSWLVDATARRVHGHVVVDLVVEAPEGQQESTYASLSTVVFSHRGDGTTTPMQTTARLTVLDGASRLFPLDYRTADRDDFPGGEWWPVSDLKAQVTMVGGQQRVFTYVFPRLDVDEVTLQAGAGTGWPGDFRLTDVPVLPEESFPPAG